MKPYVLVCDAGDGHTLSMLARALSGATDALIIKDTYQPTPMPTLSAICFSAFSNCCAFDFDRALRAWERLESWRAFLARLAPVNLEPNPLAILSRALNARLPMRNRLVPRWKRGRWKAKS